MRRLIFGFAVVMLAALTSGVADASCAVLPGERSDRLLQIAAGDVHADVAFIGRVVARREVKNHGTTRQAIVFQVVATFAGAPLEQRTLIGGPSCDKKGVCSFGSEDQNYRGHGLQLVLADRKRDGLVSQSVCSDTGNLTAAEVSLMLHRSTLPFTGWSSTFPLAAGLGAVVIGGLVTAGASARRADGR